MYQLFNQFAHRYDLHTPPGHYQHDHAFVIAEALRVAPIRCRLLDVGCGTGVFLEAACAAGIDGHGLDASDRMIDRATKRLSSERLRVQGESVGRIEVLRSRSAGQDKALARSAARSVPAVNPLRGSSAALRSFG